MSNLNKELDEKLKLYAVTDAGLIGERDFLQCIRQAISGGITMLQYREKKLKDAELKKEAIKVRDICRENDITFIVNDNVELVKEICADGVHLGASDMEISKAREILGNDYIIGATAKTIEQAVNAKEAGANYLGSGAVFGTTTKLDAKPMDINTLKAIVKSVGIPVVAIGGIIMGIIFLVGLGIYVYIYTIYSSIKDMRNRDIARNKKWYLDSQNKIRSVKTNRQVILAYNTKTKTKTRGLMDVNTYTFED